MLKNITFSADEKIIRKAREKSHKRKQSLNVIFRKWLEEYANDNKKNTEYRVLMKELKHVNFG